MLPPWYEVVLPHIDIRSGHSLDPADFIIRLDQIATRTAPDQYNDSEQFFARTCFTDVLTSNVEAVLTRLAGYSSSTASIQSLRAPLGGGKTHTLATLYHLVKLGNAAHTMPAVHALRSEVQDALRALYLPRAKVGILTGGGWHLQSEHNMPWMDLARQVLGDKAEELRTHFADGTIPTQESFRALLGAAGQPVLLLFDDLLDAANPDPRTQFGLQHLIETLEAAMADFPRSIAVISLPVTPLQADGVNADWLRGINILLPRLASNLVSHDEVGFPQIVRLRLFADLASYTGRGVAEAYAGWCVAHRAELSFESVGIKNPDGDTSLYEILIQRFEQTYPFHPTSLAILQRRWYNLFAVQGTQSLLSMLTQWVVLIYNARESRGRDELLLTLGLFPLYVPAFREAVATPGQVARMETFVARASALDSTTGDGLGNLHQRVAAAIYLMDIDDNTPKQDLLPALRFAIGGPGIDLASVDQAATALETSGS